MIIIFWFEKIIQIILNFVVSLKFNCINLPNFMKSYEQLEHLKSYPSSLSSPKLRSDKMLTINSGHLTPNIDEQKQAIENNFLLKCQSTIEHLQSELEAQMKKFLALESQHKNCNGLHQKINSLQKQLEFQRNNTEKKLDIEIKFNELKAHCENLLTQNTDLTKRLQIADEENTKAKSIITQWESTIYRIQEDFQRIEQDKIARETHLEAQISAILQENDDLKELLNDSDHIKVALEKKIEVYGSIESELREMMTIKDEALKKSQDAFENVLKLQETIKEKNERLTDEVKKSEKMSQRVVQLEASVEKLTKENQHLLSDVQKVATDRVALVSKLEQECLDLREKLEQEKAKNQKLKKKKISIFNEKNELDERKNTLEDNEQLLKKQNHDLKLRLEKCQKEFEHLHKEMKDSLAAEESENKKVDKKIKNLKNKVKNLQEELCQYRHAIDKKRIKNRHKKQQIQNFYQEIETMRMEIQKLVQENSILQNNLIVTKNSYEENLKIRDEALQTEKNKRKVFYDTLKNLEEQVCEVEVMYSKELSLLRQELDAKNNDIGYNKTKYNYTKGNKQQNLQLNNTKQLKFNTKKQNCFPILQNIQLSQLCSSLIFGNSGIREIDTLKSDRTYFLDRLHRVTNKKIDKSSKLFQMQLQIMGNLEAKITKINHTFEV